MNAFVLVIIAWGAFGVSTATVDMNDEMSCKRAAKQVSGHAVSAYCVVK